MRGDDGTATAAGSAGSVLVTVGALLGRPGLVHVYAGLALLVLAWWLHGRSGTTRPRLTLALWAGPLPAAPPLFSRDVSSYPAQGLMIADGSDVHRYGPAALGGPVAAQVPEIWQHTPSPYGPVSMVVARVVTAVTGEHLAAGVLGMRLVALAALVLTGLVVPLLAPGHTPAVFRPVVLNPLVLLHLVGGAHNDALLVGLLAAGLAAALRDRPVVGAVLVTAAAPVKVPAALGLAAVAVIWVARRRGREAAPGGAAGRGGQRWAGVSAGLATGAVAAGTTVVVTAVAGTGYG